MTVISSVQIYFCNVTLSKLEAIVAEMNTSIVQSQNLLSPKMLLTVHTSECLSLFTAGETIRVWVTDVVA